MKNRLKEKSKSELDKLEKLWFDKNSSEILEGWPVNERDENYYVNLIYQQIVFNLPILENGNILVLGTHNCVSFDKLCKNFDNIKCIGFDLFNPTNHPNVIIKDCAFLSQNDNLPISFCHNDISSFWIDPELKLSCQEWAAKNVIKGGFFLGNNNYNKPRYDIEGMMEKLGFKNIQLKQYCKEKNINIGIDENILRGYMISIKL